MGMNASSHPSPVVNTLGSAAESTVCCVVHFHPPPRPLRRHVTGHNNESTRAVCNFHKVCETESMPSAVHTTTSLMDDISVLVSGNMIEVSLSDKVLRPLLRSDFNLIHDMKTKEDI